MRRTRAIIRAVTIVSSLFVLLTPLLVLALLVWQAAGPATASTSSQARVVFDSREAPRAR